VNSSGKQNDARARAPVRDGGRRAALMPKRVLKPNEVRMRFATRPRF
jgi:hypothetical protein